MRYFIATGEDRGLDPGSRRELRGSFLALSVWMTSPVRIFGPAMSIRMVIDRPVWAPALRTSRDSMRQMSGLSCAQLIRATSMPRCARSSSRAGFAAASPGSVTMMRPRRCSGGGPNKSSVADTSRVSPAKN